MVEIQIFTPLLVEVQRGRWVAIPAVGNTYSDREKELIQHIKLSGGIDETVPQGFYHFNAIEFNGKDQLTLRPLDR